MYTLKETAILREQYAFGLPVEDIAALVGKPTKSVIAKLSAEGVYVPKVKQSKITGGKPKTKLEFVNDIVTLLEVDALEGLDKAPKGTLIKLQVALEGWLGG